MTKTCEHCAAEFGPSRHESAVTFAGRRFCSASCYYATRRGKTSSNPRSIWDRIDTSGGPDACWPWTGRRQSQGYPELYQAGQRLRVTRLVLAEVIGRALTNDELACHRCDNPPCCNPAHLFVGTDRLNALDKVAKGRSTAGRMTGESNPSARLRVEDVLAIRRLAEQGVSASAAARQFGISGRQARQIIARQRWAKF